MSETMTVLITGGTGALGQPVVQAALQRGHATAVVYRDPNEWKNLEDAVGVTDRLMGLQGDVLSPEFMAQAVQDAVDRFGCLDGLLHLVGGYAYVPLAEMGRDMWERMLSLNLTSAYVVAHAVLPALTASHGSMVFVGSQGAIEAAANQSAYNASKAGLVAFAKTLANELRPIGVRVNAVVPDIVDTPVNRRSMPNANHDRWLTPEQVASALLFLLSDESSGVSGAAITLQQTRKADR